MCNALPRLVMAGLCFVMAAFNAPAEVPPQIPSTIYTYASGSISEDRMMASLQGIVARQSPEIYIPAFSIWLDEVVLMYPEIDTQLRDPLWFLNNYKHLLSGYIRYDTDLECNVATSLAGVLDAVIVDGASQFYAQAAGLTRVADVRGKDNAWAWANYGHLFNRDYLIHLDPVRPYALRDFAVYKGSFVFYEDAEWPTYYGAQNPHTWQFGWGIEFDYFQRGSLNALMSPAMSLHFNASVLSQWKLPPEKQKTNTPADVPIEPNVHYVAFVMSDGDNFSWFSQGIHFEPRWWTSPHRGTFTMNWDLSPSYVDVNPVAFNWFMDTASQNEFKDYFVNANGAATVYPGDHPDIAGFAPVNGFWMAKADQTVMSILESTFDLEAYETIVEDPRVIGAMLKLGPGYVHNDGQIYWHQGKPIMGVRYSMWDGFYTPDGLADILNNNPRDPLNDQLSYSLVNVHPWSQGFEGDPMSNIRYVIDRLDPAIRVVTLEEMIIHLRNNFGRPVYSDCNNNGIPDLSEARDRSDEYFIDADSLGWQTNGDAARGAGVLELTPSVGFATGSAVSTATANEPVAALDVEFDFRMSGGSGDGGLCFALLDSASHTPSALFGETGPGAASLAIEFDTSSDDPNESDNHLDVWLNGVSLGSRNLGFSLDDGNWRTARVQLRHGTLSVSVQARRGVFETAYENLSLPGYSPITAYYGFGASTGVSANQHEIDNVTIIHHLAADSNANGVLDACETPGDIDHNGVFEGFDVRWMEACFQGPDNAPACNGSPKAMADNDDDNDVDMADYTTFQDDWEGIWDPNTGGPGLLPNILLNPDFESESGGFPLDWFRAPTGVSWTTEFAVSPTHSVKQVDTSTTTNTGWRSKAREIPAGTQFIQVDWNWRYENLSPGWQRVIAYGTGVDGIGNLTGFFDQDIQGPASTASSGWESHSVQLAVPPHPTTPGQPVYVDLRFRSWGQSTAFDATGTMWVDDATIRPVEAP